MKSLEEIVAAVNEDQPELILTTIAPEKLHRIPNEICKLLTKNGLSFRQAELLLDIAKGRLRKAMI